MSDNEHNETHTRPNRRGIVDADLVEAIWGPLLKLGAGVGGVCLVVGSIAATYDVSWSTAITGIFMCIVLIAVAWGFLSNM